MVANAKKLAVAQCPAIILQLVYGGFGGVFAGIANSARVIAISLALRAVSIRQNVTMRKTGPNSLHFAPDACTHYAFRAVQRF